jgi:hypothetical protein
VVSATDPPAVNSVFLTGVWYIDAVIYILEIIHRSVFIYLFIIGTNSIDWAQLDCSFT